jgi:hypothetical protein
LEASDPTSLVDPTGLRWNEGWGQAFASLFGEADASVQSSFDQSNYDRTNGTGDAFGVNGLAGSHTFDEANRSNAQQDANDINAAVGAALAPAAALDAAAAAAAAEAAGEAAAEEAAGEAAAEGGEGAGSGDEPDGEQDDPTNECGDDGSGQCFVAGTRILIAEGLDSTATSEGRPTGGLFWRHRLGLGTSAAMAGPVGYVLLTHADRKRRTGRPEATTATDDGEDGVEPQWVPLLPRSWRGEYRRRITESVWPELRPLFSLESLARRW